MATYFKELEFPPSREYSSSSNYVPLEFFDAVFPISKTVDILLGYFTTNSFRVLALPLAEFICQGGKLRIIACHFINSKDYQLIFEDQNQKLIDVYDSVEKIKRSLDDHGQHFFDCLKYLMRNNQLEIKLVKFNDKLSHDKKMLFYDGDNYISTIGSLNFTLPGIIWNGESFQINVDWESRHELHRIQEFKQEFERILNDKHPKYRPVDCSMIELVDNIGENKQLEDLLVDSFELQNLELESSELANKYNEIKIKRRTRLSRIRKNNKIPSFPYPQPREYQINAYRNWLNNNKKGLFAMATGTGKTLTALNIVLSEYYKNNFYRTIILVPTDALVSQWVRECKTFNFSNVFSSNNRLWREKLKEKNYFLKENDKLSYIFISTYASFLHKNSLPIINSMKDEELIFIIDEAHGIGTQNAYNKLPKQFEKRIGLSATPDRKNDDYGNLSLNSYFNSQPPNYTFNYSLLRAINDGFLTPYRYIPKLVQLTNSELEKYQEISKKLIKHFDFKTNTYRESAKYLLIQRKNIVNKAENKLITLKDIIKEISLKQKRVSHTVVFVPEGYEEEDKTESGHLINDYTKVLTQELNIMARQFAKNDRDTIIRQFKNGTLQVLTAMKMLDEGVDIPEIKTAIFCSSTGNPRQYVQRRGRILRTSKNLDKEYATVYDMIVAPNDEKFWDFLSYDKSQQIIKMEKSVFRNEMFRVVNFLYACNNITDLLMGKDDFNELIELCQNLEIDIFTEIQNLRNND